MNLIKATYKKQLNRIVKITKSTKRQALWSCLLKRL